VDSVSPPPSPWIIAAIDESTFKVGDIPCFLDASSCSKHTSAFDASEEIKKTHTLDSKLIVSAKSTNSNNYDSEFTVSEVAIKNSKHLIIYVVVSCSGLVYDAYIFVRKQEQAAIAVKNQFQCFDLHDEHIVDFDPGGNLCGSTLSFLTSFFSIAFFVCTCFDIDRLWWIPWDRGKNLLFNGTLHFVLCQYSCETFSGQIILTLFLSESIAIRISKRRRRIQAEVCFGEVILGKQFCSRFLEKERVYNILSQSLVISQSRMVCNVTYCKLAFSVFVLSCKRASCISYFSVHICFQIQSSKFGMNAKVNCKITFWTNLFSVQLCNSISCFQKSAFGISCFCSESCLMPL